MTPIARLLSAAEGNLAAAGRRAVDSAVEPLREKGREVVAETLGTVTAAARGVAIKAALGAFASVMLIVGVVLAVMAAYTRLAEALGPTEALLVLAGAFLLLAILAAVGIALVPTRPKRGASGRRGPPKPSPSAGAAARAADTSPRSPAAQPRGDAEQALNVGLDTLLSALGEAGFKREQAGLRAGIAMARQLRPAQIASLALLGGFVMGARLHFGRRRR